MTSNMLPTPPANLRGLNIYEIKIGIYATIVEVIQDIITGVNDVLQHPQQWGLPKTPYDISFVMKEDLSSPDPDNKITVDTMYQEQADSWMMLHPGMDPGDKELFEVRIGLYSTEIEAYQIQAGVLHYLSPTDAAGMPMLEEDYQWKTWILGPAENAGEYGDHATQYLESRHGDLVR